MFKNYLKSAYRNLLKTRLFSFINIMGLAVGMAAGLLILHYVIFEKSFDNFHQASDRVYRLRYERIGVDGSGAVRFASCCPPAGKLIRERYSQVENLGRMLKYAAAVSYQDRRFIENRMFFAEPELFEVLQFEFRSGDPAEGISQPNKAFMSESTARKYFGDEDPLGKVFSVDQKTDYEVSGVFRDLPANSHLKADILLAWENLITLYGPEFQDAWGHTGVYTYLRLKPGTDIPAFEAQLAELVEAEFGEALKHYNLVMNLPLQPLRDIHLSSHFMQEYELNGELDTVNFLLIIAAFIIIMAWVNYVNLSTARTLTRAREVGLRKVAGATRGQLMGQFFLETLLINLAALILALGLIALALPLFHALTGIPPSHTIWAQGWFGPAILILLAAGILLSGLYPVMVMSSFQPVAVLKGKLGGAGSGISKGGMLTKVKAAQRAARSGAHTLILGGRRPDALRDAAHGHPLGSLLHASSTPLQARKQWLADHLQVAGHFIVDERAAQALRAGKSLLAVGIVNVRGQFDRGAVVTCTNERGALLASGLTNFSSQEAAKIMKKPSRDIESTLGYACEMEVIHRSNLVLL